MARDKKSISVCAGGKCLAADHARKDAQSGLADDLQEKKCGDERAAKYFGLPTGGDFRQIR